MTQRAEARAQESELIAAARTGEVAAFEELVVQHQERAFNVALRLLGQREDAEDATQEAFVRAYRGLRGFGGQAQFGTWLTRIVINVCRTHGARRGRWPVSTEAELPDPQAEESDPAEAAAREGVKATVHQALGELPRKFREVLVLYELEGMSYEEVAGALGRPVGTVRSRLNRARLALRDKLQGRIDLG